VPCVVTRLGLEAVDIADAVGALERLGRRIAHDHIDPLAGRVVRGAAELIVEDALRGRRLDRIGRDVAAGAPHQRERAPGAAARPGASVHWAGGRRTTSSMVPIVTPRRDPPPHTPTDGFTSNMSRIAGTSTTILASGS